MYYLVLHKCRHFICLSNWMHRWLLNLKPSCTNFFLWQLSQSLIWDQCTTISGTSVLVLGMHSFPWFATCRWMVTHPSTNLDQGSLDRNWLSHVTDHGSWVLQFKNTISSLKLWKLIGHVMHTLFWTFYSKMMNYSLWHTEFRQNLPFY